MLAVTRTEHFFLACQSCVRSGIKVIHYDFNNPQASRDICDCKIASMKAHIIKRWVNEKHDVLTAEDIIQAVESHRGLTECRGTVVEVDLNGPDVKEAYQLNKATVNE